MPPLHHFALGVLLVQQTLAQGVADELGACCQAQLLHDVRAVRLGSAHRDVELIGDFLVGVPESEQSQDVTFAV